MNGNKKKLKIKYSYGVICFRKNKYGIFEYLLVKRRFTYSFFDFLFGNYDLTDTRYINKLISRMTREEKFYLHNIQTYDELWELMWGKENFEEHKKFYHYNYDRGISNFSKIKQGYYIGSKFFSLKSFLLTNKSYSECEWGFPKGKRNENEDNKACAIREFNEETGIKEYELLDINNIYETHKGMNDVIYKTFLFFVRTNKRFINLNNRDKKEISDIQWFTLDEIKDKLREYQHSIITTINIAEKRIKSYYLEQSLSIEENTTNTIIINDVQEEKVKEPIEEEEPENYEAFYYMFRDEEIKKEDDQILDDINYKKAECDFYDGINMLFGDD